MSAKLVMRIGATHDELPGLDKAAEDYGSDNAWSEDMLFKVKLVLEELVINIMNYGYEDNENQEIAISMETRDNTFVMTIEDEGRPFNPFEDAPEPDLDASLEERRIGGLGVYLVETLMDEVEYKRKDDKNWVKIVKRV